MFCQPLIVYTLLRTNFSLVLFFFLYIVNGYQKAFYAITVYFNRILYERQGEFIYIYFLVLHNLIIMPEVTLVDQNIWFASSYDASAWYITLIFFFMVIYRDPQNIFGGTIILYILSLWIFNNKFNKFKNKRVCWMFSKTFN